MLTDAQVAQWRSQGYVIVPGLIEEKLCEQARQELQLVYPPDDPNPVQDFGSGYKTNFPIAKAPNLNAVTLHASLIDAAQQLLNERDVVLMQSVAWAKYGVPPNDDVMSNRDQLVHMDYGNNMWTHPPKWQTPNAVAAIVYYSDCGETAGATAVTPRQGDDDPLYAWPYWKLLGIGGIPKVCNREAAEALMGERDPEVAQLRATAYEREVLPAPAVGDVLFYRHDVWHRGTPVNAGKVRYVHNLAWCKRGSDGMCIWNSGWTQPMYYGIVERLFAACTPRQKQILGFPKPSAPYWKDADNVAAVSMRYAFAGWDIESYLAAEDEEGPWKERA